MAHAVSSAWVKNKEFKKPFDYTIENSQQTVTLHRLDMPDVMKLGITNEVDFMTKAIMANPQADSSKSQEIIVDAMKSAGNFEKMENMVNKICLAGLLDPKVFPVPVITETKDGKTTTKPNEAARQQGLMYVDEIPWDDRMELFGVIFESDGLTDFREEQESGVGDVPDVQTVQLPADNDMADVRSGDSEGVLPESGDLLLRP